jgi:aminoglycoside phosphotransferase (APT) family kinase protein
MTPAMQTELLRSVISAVREDLRPELQSSQALHRADLVDMMLSRLATVIETSEQLGPDNPPAVDADTLMAFHDNTAIDDSTKESLASKIAGFVATESSRRRLVENRLSELSVTEKAKKASGDSLDIQAQVFTDYLRRKFPEKTDIQVTNVTVIPGGRSKGTILLDIVDQGQTDAIVIRRDFQANPTGVSVTYEFPIIEAMWEAGIPVPEPRWLEEDVSVLGGAFIAFSRVPGKAMGTLFAPDAAPEFVTSFARTLAKLHAVDVEQSGLADQLKYGQSDHPVKAMVDTFYEDYRKTVHATPLMDAAFAWLYLQMDKIEFDCTLVHGDAGFHNTMGENNELTGLLDWEFSHCGDPAEDLTYYKEQLEQVVPWQKFLSLYRDQGGKQVSEDRIQFFLIWRSVLLGVHMGRVESLFTSGASRDLRLAVTGFNSLPKILNDLATNLAAFTKAG